MSAEAATGVQAPLRVALNELGGDQWTGGLTYRRNLLKALAKLGDGAEIFVIGRDVEPVGNESVVAPQWAGSFLRDKMNGASKRFLKKDLKLSRTLGGLDIDVVFPAALSGAKGTAAIYWIPDFQYRHLPHLYKDGQVAAYDVRLQRYFTDADRIVVSSEDARKDLAEFFPSFLEKVRVMRFVAHVPESLYALGLDAVVRRYHLPAGFIYLPNQFWAHKNHGLVLEALQILKERDVDAFVVTTGNPTDTRQPRYLAQLLLKMSELGVRDRFCMLGMVPHDHVYALMRQSKFVLNPSLFEGWSTSVEEAKSVGKRVLLSDLPVHIEQDPPGGVYFDRTSAEDLADRIETLWTEVSPGPDLALEAKAREALPERMKTFARTFLTIGREAASLVR